MSFAVRDWHISSSVLHSSVCMVSVKKEIPSENIRQKCSVGYSLKTSTTLRVSGVEGVALLVDFDFHLQHIGEANSRPFIGAFADVEAIRS